MQSHMNIKHKVTKLEQQDNFQTFSTFEYASRITKDPHPAQLSTAKGSKPWKVGFEILGKFWKEQDLCLKTFCKYNYK